MGEVLAGESDVKKDERCGPGAACRLGADCYRHNKKKPAGRIPQVNEVPSRIELL